MIESLLIANRGEIACRIIRSARMLGIRTIAVYSDADARARHVELADEAIRIGPAPPRDSYLSIPAILAAAHATGARAIHPGYGFLSENAEFAQACADAGIAFVGPPAAVIRSMGSKSAAKAQMHQNGVPVLPGYHGADQSIDVLVREGARVGFPLIVKPSGGGGGKGMQIVSEATQLRGALEAARRIAERSFGDATLLLERYLPAPRHVEVQILADAHGQTLHLFDRDCSVQRRHQKLIEEAPAPGIPDDARARLHEAAITVARSIGYVSAGTVEFLYADGEFWFMEMNTRLQVEHPVTEAITGLDLVEWQLRIAAGEQLPFTQAQVLARGCAVEARVCAEDPASDFAPSAGLLEHLVWPQTGEGMRVDAGFAQGGEVPADYDSLLAKVIAWAPERPAAVARLADALDEIRAVGVTTNANWLARALRSDSFRAGAVSTRFLIDEAAALREPVEDPARRHLAASVAAAVLDADDRRVPAAAASPWRHCDAFRVGLPALRRVSLKMATSLLEVTVRHDASTGELIATCEDRMERLCWQPLRAGVARVAAGARQHRVEWRRLGFALHLWLDGTYWRFVQPDPNAGAAADHAVAGELTARLPGTVTRVLVAAGDEVEEGQPLLVIEAMKMEHTIRAPYAGRVARLCFGVGERVVEGAHLVEVTSRD